MVQLRGDGAWTRGSRDPILEVFELIAADFADKHIRGKPSIDGSSSHYVRQCSQHPHRHRYHPHLTDAGTEAQRGHSTCPKTHSSLWFQRWYLSIRATILKSTYPDTTPSVPGATPNSSMRALEPLEQFPHQPHPVGIESGGLTGECCLTGIWVVRQSSVLARDTCLEAGMYT